MRVSKGIKLFITIPVNQKASSPAIPQQFGIIDNSFFIEALDIK